MKRGINLDTAFNEFWEDSQGVVISRFGYARIGEIDEEIKRSARYAFYKGWTARQKRDDRKKEKNK